MRASELGSGVATAVSVIEYVPLAAAKAEENTDDGVAKASKAPPSGKKKTNRPDPLHGGAVAGPAAHQLPPPRNEVRSVGLRDGELIQVAPSQSTVKLVNVLVVLSKTKDPVGVGLPLITVKLMVPSVIESALA
jgi:hypothetical protein